MATVLMQRPRLIELIEAAGPGENVIYHIGSLMRDRMLGSSFLEVNATACAAWEAMEAGKVMLLQRRIEAGVFEYRVRKCAPPFVPAGWTGPYATHKKYTKPHPVDRHPVVPALDRQPVHA